MRVLLFSVAATTGLEPDSEVDATDIRLALITSESATVSAARSATRLQAPRVVLSLLGALSPPDSRQNAVLPDRSSVTNSFDMTSVAARSAMFAATSTSHLVRGVCGDNQGSAGIGLLCSPVHRGTGRVFHSI
jgi:hypothetical protein